MYKTRLLLVACLCAIAIATPTPSRNTDEASPPDHQLSKDLEDEGTELLESKIDALGDLGGLLSIIKAQFQSIIEDCIGHIIQHIGSVLRNVKLNILKVLARYTLADVFLTICDAITSLVAAVDAPLLDEALAKPAAATAAAHAAVDVPVFEYGYPYVYQKGSAR